MTHISVKYPKKSNFFLGHYIHLFINVRKIIINFIINSRTYYI